jgi:hypothetical protein
VLRCELWNYSDVGVWNGIGQGSAFEIRREGEVEVSGADHSTDEPERVCDDAFINWFKQLCLPTKFQNMELKTLRARVLLNPGELIRPENRPTLKLPTNFLYKDTLNMR